jgi:hypothetical protein
MRKRAFYKGLVYEGPIFRTVSDAVGAIDDEWFGLSRTCPKTIRKAAAGGLLSKSYPEKDMVSALFNRFLNTLPGLTKKQIAVLEFFRELCQYEGRSFALAQRNPFDLPDSYQAELMLRLFKYVEKNEVRKYAIAYQKHLDKAVDVIMPLCGGTSLFTPARSCTKQEAKDVFKTDVMTALQPLWGKFQHVRGATKLAMPKFYRVLATWS